MKFNQKVTRKTHWKVSYSAKALPSSFSILHIGLTVGVRLLAVWKVVLNVACNWSKWVLYWQINFLLLYHQNTGVDKLLTVNMLTESIKIALHKVSDQARSTGYSIKYPPVSAPSSAMISTKHCAITSLKIQYVQILEQGVFFEYWGDAIKFPGNQEMESNSCRIDLRGHSRDRCPSMFKSMCTPTRFGGLFLSKLW